MPMDWGLARDYAARDVHRDEMSVTEPEWLAATDPEPMLKFLKGRVSERKLRLFACACCRGIWELIDEERFRQLVEASEQYADRLIRRKDLVERRIAALGLASNDACDAVLSAARAQCSARWVALLCLYATTGRNAPPGQLLVPRRSDIPDASPETMDAWTRASAGQAVVLREIFGLLPLRPRIGPTCRPDWDGGVGHLARSIYDERAFDRLSLLADVLEDAGCTDADLLGHLRGPGPHVRGCWAVDLVLGKE
jgi:hypothetical protein